MRPSLSEASCLYYNTTADRTRRAKVFEANSHRHRYEDCKFNGIKKFQYSTIVEADNSIESHRDHYNKSLKSSHSQNETTNSNIPVDLLLASSKVKSFKCFRSSDRLQRHNSHSELLLVRFVCLITLICLIWNLECDSQFISHFNSRGLRGNITFDIRNKELHIESILETDKSASSIFEANHHSKPPLRGSSSVGPEEVGVPEEVDGDQEEEEGDDAKRPEIKFEWRIHSNPINSQAPLYCAMDELGPQVSDQFTKSLSGGRSIVLNKLNSWIIPMDQSVLGSLIWGKSISIRLSDEYKPLPPPPPPPVQSRAPSESSASPFHRSVSNSSSGPLAKPGKPPHRLSPIAIPNAANKPTFAPRQRPSISVAPPRPRTLFIGPAANLTKPQSLVLESNKTSSSQPSNLTSATSELPAKPKAPTAAAAAAVAPTSPPPRKDAENLTILKEQIVKLFGRTLICGNIIDSRQVKTAEAIFESSQLAGRVIIRGNEDGTTLLITNLYHLRSKITSRHDWKILATDILDDRRHEDQCKYLQVLFDPDNIGDNINCTRSNHSRCPIGDLTKKHGQIQIAGLSKSTRATFVDLNLPISGLEGSRSLFVVLYESSSTNSASGGGLPGKPATILACAQVNPVDGRKVEANFNMDGVRGSIRVSQRHTLEPATVSFNLFGLESNTRYQSIRELPLMARASGDNGKLCSNLGSIYDPYKSQRLASLNGGGGGARNRETSDMFEIGNLSSKHDGLAVVDSEYEDHYMADYMDLSLQLFGPTTIVGRSLLIHKNNGDPWVCSNLVYVDESVRFAAATFYYPVVGRVYFQQLTNDPSSETGVLVELYNPNGDKDTEGHHWALHLRPAMADFYNWSERCESVGDIYDPFMVVASGGGSGSGTNVSTTIAEQNNRQSCQPQNLINEPLRCRVGDLTLKSNQFKLTLSKEPSRRSRFYYTDLYLPLNLIVGRSVVVYDDNSPKQRGNRLACSTIKLIHPMRASVRTWNSGPTIPSSLSGYMEFEQTMPNAATKIKIDVSGFNGNVENYAIHQVWTQDDREFPCSNDSLYDIYDPYDSENSSRLHPSAHYGSLATVDRVKVGDLSKKHGTFEGLQGYQKTLIDSNAPLFAPYSIIGRSMVLRAAVNDFRWICGNIELDFDKSSTRQVIGIASFDEPRSKIAGFVRFIQLEHKDGSMSDTFVQVDVRLQNTNEAEASRELDTSRDHNWAIFVNQVGEDAFITADEVRCIAAGFKWNPYLAQDTLESYGATCSPQEQLACAMGDLGMRHGNLALGSNERRSFSDSNLPLLGNYSIMGRSLVIFDNKRPQVKLACANIKPDIHLKSNVVIKRTPSFTVARFVEQMRSALGATEWLLVPELKATKPVANGECVQMTIHFYGQKAHQMQIELNNLITLGTVSRSSRFGTTDKISTHYRLCRAGQTQLTSSASSNVDSFLYRSFAITYIITLLQPLLAMRTALIPN